MALAFPDVVQASALCCQNCPDFQLASRKMFLTDQALNLLL